MILLTGATGYLGTLVLARLLDDPDGPEILCPVRARDDREAAARVDATLARLWHEPGAVRRARVRAVAADLLHPLDVPRVADITAVLHCAAAVSFDLPLAQARAINVGGTRQVLDLARRAPRLERVVHVSTAYVGGRHAGPFGEDDLDVGQTFRNTYEQTKHEAERMLAAEATDLPVVVARPSIVVGEAGTGWTTSFNVLYPPLRAYRRGMISRAPADPDGLLDVVTGDYVADALVHLLGHGEPGRRYHLVSGDDAPTSRRVAELAAEAFGLPPLVMDAGSSALDQVYVPYFDVRLRFDDARSRALLGPHGIAPADLAECFGRLMRFAEETRWGKRTAVREDGLAVATSG